MATAAEIVQLPYPPDLTFAGVTYACKNLPRIYRTEEMNLFDQLRRMVMVAAVDLAFRRYLAAQEVPFRTVDVAHFTDPHRHDTLLGGRRTLLHTCLLHEKPVIQQVRRDGETLAAAQAFAPVEEVAAEDSLDEDVFVFAFLSALLATTPDATQRALAAGQPAFLLYPFEDEWARPPHWRDLGHLAFKSEMDEPVQVEIGGEDSARQFLKDTLELPSRKRVHFRRGYHAITYLKVDEIPTARIGVHSPVLDRTQLVGPPDWGNIWVYGMEIYLAGYLTRGEFRRTSRRVSADHRVILQQTTGVDSYMAPVAALHPISDLLARAKNWAQHRLR